MVMWLVVAVDGCGVGDMASPYGSWSGDGSVGVLVEALSQPPGG